MTFLGRMVGMVLALFMGAGLVRAAGETREQRAYAAAMTAFDDHLWNIAEEELIKFIQKYPNSELVPQAGVRQAQAEIKQGKLGAAEDLLIGLRPKAGRLADDCTYWLGEAQFQGGDLQTAEVTLASVSTNSPLALRATVEAGAVMAKLAQWPQLVKLFQDDQELFQGAELADPDNEMVLRGRLLLAQAKFEQRQYGPAGRLLEAVKPKLLPPELEWKRLYLLCRVKFESGDLEPALPLARELVAAARQLNGGGVEPVVPASVALLARVLERLPGRAAEALDAFRENLATNVPVELQREAILKIAGLAITAHQYTNAEAQLNNYAAQFTNAPALDAVWLTLGELYLHDYVSQPAMTNLLTTAGSRLDQLLNSQPNSSFAGEAHLYRGWCGWLQTNYPACLPDFQMAATNLPPSKDLAVARFKLADTYFALGDYANALASYQAVLPLTNEFPAILPALGNGVWYQSLRAQLQLHELEGATATMARIAPAYPESELSQSATLLLGEGFTDLRQPTNALAVFARFLDQVPHSPLRPAVELAIARAYEEEPNWPKAITQYDAWLKENPTDKLLPQALYARAWAGYQAGDETNALLLFTNFVSRFPSHPLAPLAQWWVADYYLRQGDSVNAERNYKFIFQNTNWQNSDLFYPAQMMAGRAAVSRTDNDGAIRDYFQRLEDDTNCPPDLQVQASFLHGSALMMMDSPDTNNPTKNFADAITVFRRICLRNPTNEPAARAWGEIGDCYLQLSRYNDATNAYSEAMTYAGTNSAVQAQAQIGLGVALEKKASLSTNSTEIGVFQTQAEVNYWDVLKGTNLNPDAPAPDLFWNKVAALKGADLEAGLGNWQKALGFYDELLKLMPELQTQLARKMDAARQHVNALKK